MTIHQVGHEEEKYENITSTVLVCMMLWKNAGVVTTESNNRECNNFGTLFHTEAQLGQERDQKKMREIKGSFRKHGDDCSMYNGRRALIINTTMY